VSRVVHIIGNGDMAQMYKPAKGIKLTCNLPPFEVQDVYATAIVDFKMCRAINEGSVNLDSFQWICGFRPEKYCTEMNPGFYMKHAHRIRQFYTVLPKYAKNYTNLNCGHFITHYAANVLDADEIHMYGFDSLFDTNMNSFTDLILNSDRGNTNNYRLIQNWRPVWEGIFNQFKSTKFVFYHKHTDMKVSRFDNIHIDTSRTSAKQRA